MKSTDRVFITDWETSGLRDLYNTSFHSGAQGIQFGGCVVEDISHSWTIVDEIQFDVKWMGDVYPDLTWNDEAEKIHGLSKEYLANKKTPEETAMPFQLFIERNFKDSGKVMMGGFNPHFDEYFTYQFMTMAKLRSSPIGFHYRMLDMQTLGTTLLGLSTTNEVFKKIGVNFRGKHNALQDARLTVDAFRMTVQQARKFININKS